MPINIFFIHLTFAFTLVIVSFSVTWMLCYIAEILDCSNDSPANSTHAPKGGGLAIVISFFIGMIAIYVFGEESHINNQYMMGFIFSSIFIVVVSLYDDINNKSINFKLLSYIFAVILALYSGIVLDKITLPILGETELGWIGYLLSAIWILGLTSAFKFIDGLDGLAGGITVIAGISLMAISYYSGSYFVYISCYTLVAGTLGFLIFNISPAKIFMGDVGSAFIGFTFATLSIIAARYDSSHLSFFVVPLLLFNIIYDFIFTLFRKQLSSKHSTKGHHSHLYQLMNQIGYSHLEVSLIHYCMALSQGLGAIWMLQVSGNNRIYVFIPFFLLQLIYTILIMKKAKKLNII